jgi:hypothetical protein
MKKGIFIIILGVLTAILPFSLSAEDITLGKARATAEMFFSNCGVSTRAGSSLTLVNAEEIAATRSASEAYYYIFNRKEGGFVIISALDAARPVLAYSFEHSFPIDGDMPENLRDMLALYRYQIKARRDSGEKATEEELSRWRIANTATRAGIPDAVDLQTPDWGQGAPYNRFCPLDTLGNRTITGCTATAICEVMYFYKWPKAGHGTLPGYTKDNNIVIPELTLGHEYQWDKMIPKYKNAVYTDEQADAVARLMYDVGVMCQAKYGVSSTSASSATGVPRLAEYFYYDKAITKEYHAYLTDDTWKDIVRNEVGSGRPMLMFSNIPAGGSGHNFVIDGYDAEGRFLVNWGWHGGSNGYYYVGAFYGGYNVGQIAFIGVRPDRGGNYVSNAYLRKTTSNGVLYNGMTYTSGNVIPGSQFKIRFGAVYNVATTQMDIEIQFGHFNKKGELKGYLRPSPLSSNFTVGNYKWWSSVTITVPSDVTIEKGDYMEPLYRGANEIEWKHFANSGEMSNIVSKFPLDLRNASSISYTQGSQTFVLNSFIGVRWTLTDPDGMQIRSATTATTSTKLNLSQYPSGTYTLDLEYGSQKTTVKLTY